MNQHPILSALLRYELDALAVAHAALLNHENPDFDNEDDPANTWSTLEARQHLIDMLKANPKKLVSLLPRLTAYVEHGFSSHTDRPATVH